MHTDIEYGFPSEAIAYKFLNTVRHFDAEALRVRLGRNDHHVSIAYRPVTDGFDPTLSELDDLARELGGEEAR
ncbi:hypothetical protein [Alteromonas halophila]|uniref:Uncharacterized protein n=1 Tax=Alteromonas halophila TaxID=516698 RepID=A0A918JER6_9ALTE|nr:hypothetical protein [Alteromonas halophila]GGW77075.1 hypothetical protein GCM10007391_07490 [Alteromonas halophila]